MPQRRLVTGVTRDGESVVVSDGPAPRSHRFRHIPGHASTVAWATDSHSVVPNSGADPTRALTRVVPGPGATVVLVVELPPDAVFASEDFDPLAARQEQAAVSPGLLEHFEADSPFHATPTVDYMVLLRGSLWLVLDHTEIEVSAGDMVVQNGTRHAWQNRSGAPAEFLTVLVGVPQIPVDAPAEGDH